MLIETLWENRKYVEIMKQNKKLTRGYVIRYTDNDILN